ncbi:MAG: DPP IV N-terminal domain-containing protein [Planctomycetaceae bacterium]|jgi:dipeptidyl-peptidase-4|nr:DPP IV N-terminal domain-containing protein [Planctomycetaceae bacterium]
MRKLYQTFFIGFCAFLFITPRVGTADNFALAQTSIQTATTPDTAMLTVPRIYGDEFSEASIPFTWDTEESKFRVEENGSYYLEDPITGKRTLLIDAQWLAPTDSATPLKAEALQFSEDRSKVLIFTNTRRVWRHNTRGDYWVLDLAKANTLDNKNLHAKNNTLKNNALTKLGGAEAEEASLMFAKLSPDATQAAFVRGNNLYLEDLTTHKVTPLTTDGGDRYINGTFDWVYEEEFSLADGFRWAPDSKKIAYWQLDTAEEPTFTMIDHLSEKYPVTRQFKYPRAGDKNAAARIGVVSVDRNDEGFSKTKWIQIPGDPSEHYITAVHWIQKSNLYDKLIVQQFNRLQNQMKIYLCDIRNSQKTQVIAFDESRTWIDFEPMHWLKYGNANVFTNGGDFLWQSERTGLRYSYVTDIVWTRNPPSSSLALAGSSLYLIFNKDEVPDQLEVIDFLSWDYEEKENKRRETGFYFSASPENATQKYLYRIALDGSECQRITPKGQDGTHTYRISPDATLAIHKYSRFGVPPIVELIRLPSHDVVRTLTDNRELKEKLSSLKLGKAELFQVTTAENVTMDGWAIYPPDYRSNNSEKYPVIVYVYGEPAGQTVLDQWGEKNYLWHQMLAQRGAVVMSFDNRGTPAPKGREWRQSIYRKLGQIAPKDQADAMRESLKNNPKLDANRVAIWGWSGGGTSTLHAMFQYPDVYQVGVAVAAVADERNYDTIYQERYLGNPAADAAEKEEYRRNSPMTYAHNLKGELLVIHGTADDNCHYQTFDMLIDTLIKHGKQFRMMSYPSRSHGIFERAGTTVHLRTLILDFLTEKLGLKKTEK